MITCSALEGGFDLSFSRAGPVIIDLSDPHPAGGGVHRARFAADDPVGGAPSRDAAFAQLGG